MPVVREHVSISQFCELLAIPVERFNGVEVDKRSSQVTLVLEPEEQTMSEYDGITHPSSFTVDHERKPRLYTADGTALVRTAGFTSPIQAVQTSGTNPPLTQGGKTIGGKKGKGGRKC